MIKYYLHKFAAVDWMLMIALMGILLFGFTALYSIDLGREGAMYLKHQLIAFAVGTVVMIVLATINFRMLKNVTIPVYCLSILLLVAVLFFGEKIRGTRGWFTIGGFGFQPAEFVKIALILGLARYFSSWTRQIGRLRPIVISALITILPIALIILQPDFGSALIVFGIWLSMILMSGIPKRYVATLGVLFVTLFAVAWLFVFQDYQKDRILTFVSPRHDSAGAGYNVRQALIAIGAGQLVGQGIGEGSQSQLRFLPEAQTDFIFAVIAEELGFIGVAALLLLWLLLFYRLIRILRNAGDDFSAFIVFGTIIVLFSHVVINIGGNLGLLPVTGLVLPFVSYGGSALVIALSMIGLVQSVKIHSA